MKKSLKILYIGFGIKPFAMGGAIITQDFIMEEMIKRGHEVVSFLAAPRYFFRKNSFLKKWNRNGVKIIELCNSPCRLGSQNDPLIQCNHPIVEMMVRKILKEERPDIVHIHELQLHPISIIDIIAEAGIKSVKTIHNYYDICPQRDLFYRGKESCKFFPSTEHCAECMSVKSIKKHNGLFFLIKWGKNITKYFISKKIIDKYRTIRFPDKIIKDNDQEYNGNITPLYSSEKYDYRQKFFVNRLNKLDAIHCSTSRSAEIFSMAGVQKKIINIFPPSNKKISDILPKSIMQNNYPISFGYAGGFSLHKGYKVVLDAFSKLDQKKAKLIIWRNKKEELPSIFSDLNIEMREGEINDIFKEIDVGIVPSIWEEVFGLIGPEFLSARIPVIGSRIGGIPEWLKDGENGFLVKPGDTDELAEKMNLFVKNPGLVAQFQKKIKVWKSFDEHVDETIELYERLLK